MTNIAFHSDAVDDVINTILEYGFFNGNSRRDLLSEKNYFLVESLDDIDRFRDPDWPHARINFPMVWSEMLERTTIPLLKVYKGRSIDEKLAHAEKARRGFSRCEKILEERAFRRLGDERHGPDLVTLVCELINIRAACGVIKDSFLEELWEVIVLGGYPCGWCGGNDGRLVVYVPSR